jgi:hypothetical protein
LTTSLLRGVVAVVLASAVVLAQAVFAPEQH